MVKFVEENHLKAVFPYLDNITICGKDQKDHAENLKEFLEAAKLKNICYSDEKSVFSTHHPPLLGYVIEEGNICPDPKRLRPLLDLPIPQDSKSLNRHFLTGRYFTQKTDQKSVAYVFDQHHKGKIKNDKIMRWRLEQSCYSFDIIYCPGKENIPPDILSRATYSAATDEDFLYKLHVSLCHPGVTGLHHFVRTKNLP